MHEDPNCTRIRQRHAEHLCASLEHFSNDWDYPATDDRASDHACWVDDVRRALDWAFAKNGLVALGVRLTVAAIPMWENFSFVDESIAHLSHALSEGRRMGFDDAGAEVRLQLALASAIMYARGLAPEADGAWDLALTLADRSDDADCQLRALWGRAVYDLHAGRPARSVRSLGLFLDLCRTLSDQSAAPDGERLLSAAEMYLGDLRGAKARAQRLSDLYLKAGQPLRNARFQLERGAALNSTIAMLSWLTGERSTAVALAEDTVRTALASGHAVSLCNVLSLAACPIALWEGRSDDAERYLALLQEQLKGARLKLWAQYGRCLEGAVLIQRNGAAGLEVLEHAIEDFLATGSATPAPAYMGMLAEAQARHGRIDEAMRSIENAVVCEATQGERWCLPELLRIEAAIRVLQGEFDVAEKLLRRSIALAEEIGATTWALRSGNDLASLERVS